MQPVRHLLVVAALFVVAALVAACSPAHSPVAPPTAGPHLRDLASLRNLDGSPHDLAQHRGHPLLLHFGASW